MLDYPWVKLEAAGCEAVAAARVAAVEDWHIVFLSHRVDGVEQAQEVLLCVDVFLTVSAQQDVAAFFQTEAGVDIAGFDFSKVLVKDLGHRGACDVCAFFREAAVGKVAACVLAVGHVHVGDDVNYAAVGLLREAFILAAVAGFHVEYRDMEAFGTDYAQAAVGVAKDQNSVRFGLYHQFVALCYDISHRFAQVGAYCVHIYFRICEFQVLEEDAVEVVVVVLAGVGKDDVEVFAAFVDYCRQTDDFRAGAYYYQEFEFAVVFEMDI